MTDVLDRDGATPSAAQVREIVEHRSDFDLTNAARLLLAALAIGAGAIHLAMVPSHWGESVIEGLGFAVTGWLQLAFAVAVIARPSRLLLRLGIVVNAAAIGAWFVSRTAGLPFGAHSGHAESVGFLDVTCVALEAALILVSAVLLFRPRIDARFARKGFGIAVLASIGVLALTTGALASPGARNHAAGSHGDHGAAAGDGHAHDDAAAAATDGHAHDASGAPVDDKGLSLLSNGHHAHIQLSELDVPTQKALDAQLAVTREVALLTPTVADAEAAGYTRVGPYFPGIGAHYWKGIGADVLSGPRWNPDGFVDDVDLREPLMLIFDGTNPTSKMAGFMYYSAAGTEPTGFEGRNDFWHYHESLCLKFGADGVIDVPYGLDHQATQAQCDAVPGARMIEASQYMVHVWSVPGFEMTDEYGGVFGEVNPKLACADGTYYQFPVEEWMEHPLNVCKAQ